MQTLINTAVGESLQALCEALTAFNRACAEPGAVVQGVIFNAMDGHADESDSSCTDKLLKAINTWDIADESLNGSVVRYPGAFEVTESVIHAANVLNEAKSNFSSTVTALEGNGADSRQLRIAYRAAEMPRIHPLQAWRQIVTLEGPDLASIGFTVSKMCHSIQVMPVSDAINRLTQCNALDIVDALSSLNPNNTIHWHTPVSRHIRANVVWNDGENRSSQMFHASLPFLVAAGSWPSKRIRFNQPREHSPRRDKKGLSIATFPLRKGAYLVAT